MTPHIDSLAVGDRIDHSETITCCRSEMGLYGIGDIAVYECGGCGCQVPVDWDPARGECIVTDPPGRIAPTAQLADPEQPQHTPASECGHEGPPSRA